MLDVKKLEQAINMLSADKKLDKEKIVEIIEAALKTAYKKAFDARDEDVIAKVDLETGEVEMSIEKTVVTEVENPAKEISFKELWDDADWFSEGDVIEIDVTDTLEEVGGVEGFGRIAAGAAKQVIMQKLNESEKEKIYDLFKNKKGELINMKVEMLEWGKAILDYNGNRVPLVKGEQGFRDKFVAGARIYVYVAEAEITETTGPRIVLSRKNPELVSELFKVYVPELTDDTINIEAIVRNPGIKTKMVVSSNYEEIDPVGTLVGQKWMRVKSVMDELFGEKIDIIPYDDDFRNIVKKSLSPAEVDYVEINEEEELAKVFVRPSQRAKALGRNGSNINLASRLLGYTISLEESDRPDIVPEEEVQKVEK